MDRYDGLSVPDHVPEDWQRRYGTRPEGATGGGGLVVWLALVILAAGGVVWLGAGVRGLVALIVPLVAIAGGAVLVVRWVVRTSGEEPDDPA